MNSEFSQRILFVDDDVNLLQGLARQFRGKYDLHTAEGGVQGPQKMQSEGSFAVIISDMRMPEMNGIQFLMKARELNADSVRIMLTGNADLDTAVHAVNEGNIYRFLMKPCKREVLEWAIDAALEQYRLVTAERELLEKTLKGSIQVLIDILSLVNPTAFSRASRLREYVSQVARKINAKKVWQFELAALLSQIGCVGIPSDILSKVYGQEELTDEEERIYLSHPEFGGRLLSRIPRLEVVGKMIAGQGKSGEDLCTADTVSAANQAALGALILKTCIEFDSLISRGMTKNKAVAAMKLKAPEHLAFLLKALESVEIANLHSEMRVISIRDLTDSMVLAQDIKTRSGMLVAPKGQKVTLSMRVLIENYSKRNEIDKRIQVLLSSSSMPSREWSPSSVN
jgi:ActR/RegA family two-component response regulator